MAVVARPTATSGLMEVRDVRHTRTLLFGVGMAALGCGGEAAPVRERAHGLACASGEVAAVGRCLPDIGVHEPAERIDFDNVATNGDEPPASLDLPEPPRSGF